MTTICRHCGLAGEHKCTEQSAPSPTPAAPGKCLGELAEEYPVGRLPSAAPGKQAGGEVVAWIKHESYVAADGLWDFKTTTNFDGDGNPLVLASDLDAMREERDRRDREISMLSQAVAICKDANDALRARLEQVEGALRELHIAVPSSLDCLAFHHGKKDQHEYSEECKPLERFREAMKKAGDALAAGGKNES